MTASFSPKLEIINHYDNLINRIDIHIEECLKKYDKKKVLGKLECFRAEEKYPTNQWDIYYTLYKPDQKKNEFALWSESTKVVDYLNQVRQRTIDELRLVQEKSLKNSSLFNNLKYKDKNLDELKSELFGDNFYFQVHLTRKVNESWVFDLFTFNTDFYLTPSHIELLENALNLVEENGLKRYFDGFKTLLDEKIILVVLIYRYLCSNLRYEKFPYHVIRFKKKTALEKTKIFFLETPVKEANLTDLPYLEYLSLIGKPDLERINLDGLVSLKCLKLNLHSSIDRISIRGLTSLEHLIVQIERPGQINSDLKTKLLDFLPNIEKLTLLGNFSDLILDCSIVKMMLLGGTINTDFNFNIFENVRNYLEQLKIDFENMNDENMIKLFDGHNFPYLSKLVVTTSKMTRLKKKLFDGFPMLTTLGLSKNKEFRRIDHDAFSNLKHLVSLDLNENSIELLDYRHFSQLDNLKRLNLSNNQIEFIPPNMFSNLKRLEFLDLSDNKVEIVDSLSFVGLGNLETLYFNFNKLEYFDLDIFNSLSKLKRLNLYENPILNDKEITKHCQQFNIRFSYRDHYLFLFDFF